MSDNGIQAGGLPVTPNPQPPLNPGLSDEQQRALVELAGTGANENQIAEQLGLGLGTVRRYARKLGVQLKRGSGAARPPVPPEGGHGAADGMGGDEHHTAGAGEQRSLDQVETQQTAAPPEKPAEPPKEEKPKQRRTRKPRTATSSSSRPEPTAAAKPAEPLTVDDLAQLGVLTQEAYSRGQHPEEYVEQHLRPLLAAWERAEALRPAGRPS